MATTPDDRDRPPTPWQLMREDFHTHGRSRVQPGMHALVLHRLGQAAYARSTPKHRLGRIAYRLGRIVVAGLYNIEIPLDTRIGRRLHLPHPHGIVVNGNAVIGDDCMIRHNVTIGAASDTRHESPTIGNRVHFGPGAVVIGGITVGDDAHIGPNALVVDDVPAGSRVVAPVAAVKPPRSGQTSSGTGTTRAEDG